MTPEEQVALYQRGVETWNAWRKENPDVRIHLEAMWDTGASPGVDLTKAYLYEAHFMRAYMPDADFRGADLRRVDFRAATLEEARFDGADLRGATLTGAFLQGTSFRGANLGEANLGWARLNGADLRDANLSKATCVEADLRHANLTGCTIYGIAAWQTKLEGSVQTDLIITPPDEPTVTVDSLEVAQFVYLLLHNERIRDVIDTVGRKAVLILGRFTPARKQILKTIREDLRVRGYLPILFDFEKPTSRDLTETISILAHMARFIIADLTDAKSIPQELSTIVPHLPSVPVQPILLASRQEYAMFEHWRQYPWVLDEFLYESRSHLSKHLNDKVIIPAERQIEGESTEDNELARARRRVEELERQLARKQNPTA